MNIVQDATFAALGLALCAFVLLVLSIDVIRSRPGTIQAVAVLAAAGAAVAGFVAFAATEHRLERIESAVGQRSAGPGMPAGIVISSGQLDALRAGLSRAALPSGFLFAVLSTCGPAQAQALAVIGAMRHAGGTVFAPAQCGPIGTTAAVTVIVNARSKFRQAARKAAGIIGSALALASSAPVIAVPALSGDVIVLLTS